MWQSKPSNWSRGRELKLLNQSQIFVPRCQIRGRPDKLASRQFTNVRNPFPLLSWIFHLPDEMVVSASLHSAIRRFLPYTISLTVILIPCSQYSIFRKFFGKVHEIKFLFMKANFIAFFSVASSSIFSQKKQTV